MPVPHRHWRVQLIATALGQIGCTNIVISQSSGITAKSPLSPITFTWQRDFTQSREIMQTHTEAPFQKWHCGAMNANGWRQTFSSMVSNGKTCSLFLIQHETMGGLPLKGHATRAACPACSRTCTGGFLNCNAGPAKTKQSHCCGSESCFRKHHYERKPVWFQGQRWATEEMFAGGKWLHYLMLVYIFEQYYFYRQTFIIVAYCRVPEVETNTNHRWPPKHKSNQSLCNQAC